MWFISLMGHLVRILQLADNEKNHTFMKLWIGLKKQSITLSIIMKRKTDKNMIPLMKNRNVNYHETRSKGREYFL